MSFRVVGANNRRTQIGIELPFTASGDWAFDDDGDPIDGKQAVVITLPRFDCLPVEDIVLMQNTIKAIEANDKSSQESGRDIVLAMLKPHVLDESVYNLLTKRTLFELQQISEEWSKRSVMSPGELLASNGSSTSTRKPSTTNSSASA